MYTKILSIIHKIHSIITLPPVVVIGAVSILVGSGAAFAVYKNIPHSPSPSVLAEEATKNAVLEVFADGVFVMSPGETAYTKAVTNMKVTQGTKIQTNDTGFGQILYPNNSVTRIDSDSEITLSQYSDESFQVTVFISAGRVWSRVAKLLGKETYKTETSNMVATIRGTSYGHQLLPGSKNEIVVTKSVVDGACKNADISQAVETGMDVIFDCESQVDPIVKEFDEDALEEDSWIKKNETEDEKLHERFGYETYNDDPQYLEDPQSLEGKGGRGKGEEMSQKNTAESKDTGGKNEDKDGDNDSDEYESGWGGDYVSGSSGSGGGSGTTAPTSTQSVPKGIAKKDPTPTPTQAQSTSGGGGTSGGGTSGTSESGTSGSDNSGSSSGDSSPQPTQEQSGDSHGNSGEAPGQTKEKKDK